MYTDYYHFKEDPFSVTSDPSFFFSSKRHSEAFSHLVYGIEQRKGIIIMTGEIGTGKTTLCRTFLNQIDNNVKTALVLNPYFSEKQLLQLILKDYGIEGTFTNKLDLVDTLNTFLIEQSSEGNNVVLIIDEAQNLRPKQLEQIRLLSNLETEKSKLLQIILVGQPELLEKLRIPSLRQINQRISVRYHILPLQKSEVNDYIHHRLKIASENGNPCVQFSSEAIDLIFAYSKGTPRLINILCDRALLSGYVKEVQVIERDIVYTCAREVGEIV